MGQTVCPDLYVKLLAPLSHQINIHIVILMTKKGRLSAIVSLDHVMRHSRSDYSCYLTHKRILGDKTRLSGIQYGVPGAQWEALYCYKGHKAYQPLNAYWAEQDLVLHSKFRDGNVWAGPDNLRVFTEAWDLLPAGVSKVYLRSDTAGYQHDLMRFCADPNKPRFGVIEFAIGAKVTESFKGAVSEVEESEWHSKPVG
jgi:hypothetical protein